MRDIKFRFFDGVEMNYNIIGYDFNCGGVNKEILAVWNKKQGCIDYYDALDEELDIMQYTGLKDMNNREIYEGDILESYRGTKYKVVFNKGCFKVQNIKHLNQNLYLLEESGLDFIKVIGNIYEDKDKF